MSDSFAKWFLHLRAKRLDYAVQAAPMPKFCPICGLQHCNCIAKVARYILQGGAAPWM